MKNLLKRLVPRYICDLKPYEPGKPVEEVERELGIRKSIKMASNENPLGPSGKGLSAAQHALKNMHYYPDGACYRLRERLAKKLGVREEELVFGTGSNEVIELLMRCLVRGGDNIVVSQYAFLVYGLVAQGLGAETREAPATNYGHDLSAMAELVDRKTKLVFVANPNNPTGSYCDGRNLASFLKAVPGVPVVLDEAYNEYVEARDYPDSISLRKRFPNLVILRTFSKIYGLAGLRIGYGIASAELAQYLNRLRQPFNVNSIAQSAAAAAIADREHVSASRKLNGRGKKFLYNELSGNDVEFLATEANFILVKTGNGRKSYEEMLRLGVVVRPMDVYGLPGFIRVTIGKEDQNRKFVSALLKTMKR